MMKKILECVLTAVMGLTLLTACGNPVYDDLENFMNVEMVEVNENYKKIAAEAGTWENIEDETELQTSIENNMLPYVNDSLEKLEKITPKTEEVKELKDTYVQIMQSYKEGFEEVLAGIKALDEDMMLSGNEKLENGLQALEEYNAALEALAADVGAEIEY